VLVIGQTALALVLIAAGGLLVNSAVRLALVEPGFNSDGILMLRPRLDPNVFGGAEAPATPFYRDFMGALQAIPGVRGVSGTMFVPGEGLPVTLRIEAPTGGEALERWRHTVFPSFFETLEIPIVEGRSLGPQDSVGAGRAAVVSESLARELWPERSAVGRSLSANDGRTDFEFTIVGVAADIHNRGPHHAPEPVLYESFLQNPWLPSAAVLVRHEGDARSLMPAVRDALRSASAATPLGEVASLSDLVARNTVEERHYAVLLAIFSVVALSIAAVGVYATVACAVARRLRELAIRLAVGARGADVMALVLRRGMLQAGAGAILGLALATVATGALEGFLFEVTPADPLTFVGAAAVLFLAALLACLVPALRATRVDPLTILRSG
jgi:predicted permease